MWLVWTGGNDRLWDEMTVKSVGTFDLLKTVSSYPGLKASRDNRWNYLGLVNEPCYKKATAPDPNRYGLWLDTRDPSCGPEPFENESKYPGVKIGARGKNIPVGSYYGYATGIVGLRMFPNPDFDEEAAKKWDAEAVLHRSQLLQRQEAGASVPRGMSCAFCHVGPSPVKPPADPENPKWENLASNVGAQYFWIDRIFAWESDPQQLPRPAFPHLPPGYARHLAGFQRQHQQPSHHECGLRTNAAS